jgi:hypothetical protein
VPLPSSPDDFLNLDAEQQADALLASLASAGDGQRGTNLILSQLASWFPELTSGFGLPPASGVRLIQDKRKEADARLRDAYALLEVRVLIRADPRQRAFCEITPAGRDHLNAVTQPDADRVSFARRALAAFDLHEALQRKEVESHFLQGKFETAIRDGSVYVEAAIRAVGMQPPGLVGVKLASKAFDPAGPLADPGLVPGEQVGIQQLFMGYAGAIRNPVGHKAFRYGSNKKALQHLMLLDQLMEEVAEAATRLGVALP